MSLNCIEFLCLHIPISLTFTSSKNFFMSGQVVHAFFCVTSFYFYFGSCFALISILTCTTFLLFAIHLHPAFTLPVCLHMYPYILAIPGISHHMIWDLSEYKVWWKAIIKRERESKQNVFVQKTKRPLNQCRQPLYNGFEKN